MILYNQKSLFQSGFACYQGDRNSIFHLNFPSSCQLAIISMKVKKICWKRLLWTSVCVFLGTPTTVFAGQYQYCYPVTQYRTVRDPAYHPQAYEDGYREGANVARKSEKYEPRTVGGEFARGFDDGYEGRPLTGQRNTIADRQESYETSQCRN
jgi:hypothetical protein